MKILVTIARIFVGLLFIFSGLVKANDPHGLSYKMQEFFEVWGVHGLNEITLPMSILMNAFEIIAGVALIIGWRIKLFIWLLLLLIVAFTFLTGYTFATGKPKNCGCFGDCLPISSAFSFYKDVLLTVLIAFLLWQKKHIKPLLKNPWDLIVMAFTVIFSFGLQWYALKYLPPVDCLPYKKGNNIAQQMQIPANAVPDERVITFVYEKNGQKVSFTADKFPKDFDSTYKFVERFDKVVKEGKNNTPPISGFALTGKSGADSTAAVLQADYAILLFNDDLSYSPKEWENKFERTYQLAKEKNVPIYFVSLNSEEATIELAKTSFTDIPVFTCDYIAVRSAARSNPTVYLLKQGTVVEKKSIHHVRDIAKQLELLNPLPKKVAEPIISTDSL